MRMGSAIGSSSSTISTSGMCPDGKLTAAPPTEMSTSWAGTPPTLTGVETVTRGALRRVVAKFADLIR
jgi:hypothetical protein